MRKKIKHFYHGRVYYDRESFLKAVKNYPILPLRKKDFLWMFSMLAENIWINLESYNSIPDGKDWNEWLDKFFQETLDKFLKEE